MPKLNVQQNNQGVIQALKNALAIGALDGPLACDGANNFSVGQAGGGGGRNLLDNPFFTIDQTAETSGAATGGTAKDVRDRWRIARCSEYTFNDDGTVTTKWDGTGSGCYLIQYGLLDNAAFYKGKTCTLSFYADGALYQKTITMPTGTNTSFTLGGVSVKVNDVTNTGRGYEFQFYHSVSAGKTLGPFKLEEGSVSTLPNDGPPDYEEELRKCQWVFRRVKGDVYTIVGMSVNGTDILFPFPFSMRANPSTSFTNCSAVGNGNVMPITSIVSTGRSTCAIQVRVKVASTTANTVHMFTPISGGYMDFSCRPS